ncbi:hypothetical protein HOY82DRAFT_124917 [Tuber indicum]|nr:hypothetical protein HOY82DRAFT_124917 [Tuber indicum]
MLRIIRSHLRGLLRVGLWDCFMDFKAMIFGFEVEASCVGVPTNGRLQNVSKNKSSRIFFKAVLDGCPMFPSGPTDGTNCKEWCRFSQPFERPGYLQIHG